MKSTVFSHRGSDSSKIPSDVYSPRVSWATTVQKRQFSTYSSKGSSRDITPRRIFPPAEVEQSTSGRSKEIRNESKSSLRIHGAKQDNGGRSHTLLGSPSSSGWKFSLRKKDPSRSSTSSTEMDTTVSSTMDEAKYNLARIDGRDSVPSSATLGRLSECYPLDLSTHYLDDILGKDDPDDDDTVLVETRSEPMMERNVSDPLYHYQMDRLKQDRNHLHQRCALLKKKYDTVKMRASFLQNVHESLQANTDPIERHVLDAQKCGDEIEHFLQGRSTVDPPDDGVSEVTMESSLYY